MNAHLWIETMWEILNNLLPFKPNGGNGGVSEHSGEHQDFREWVQREGSPGRALTLVSFTKGVSPTRGLYALPGPWNPVVGRSRALLPFPPRAKQQHKPLEFDHRYAPPSNFQGLKTQRLDASPSNSGLSRSPVTCPTALPDTPTDIK